MRNANPEGTIYQDQGCPYFPGKLKSCLECTLGLCLEELEGLEKHKALVRTSVLLRNKSSGGIDRN